MPQVDLESLVSVCSGGSERKIACETLAVAGDNHFEKSGSVSMPPDFPPDSFLVSKEDEHDWLDRNAFIERKESHKGSSIPNSTNLNPNLSHGSHQPSSNSQRITLKHKAAVLGLPRHQKTLQAEAKNRRCCKANNNTRLFPKRTVSRGKSDALMSEPSSPKVSCMGRVRSKRDRSRKLNHQKSGRSEQVKDKPRRTRKGGLFASFRAIFQTGCRDVSARGSHSQPAGRTPSRKTNATDTHDILLRLPPGDTDAIISSERESPPRKSVGSRRASFEGETSGPGLGGMKRFASGRRSDLLAETDAA